MKSFSHKLIRGDSRDLYRTHPGLENSARLVYLDPPYNSRRKRGARKLYTDSDMNWSPFMTGIVHDAWHMLADNGFLAASINQTELFNLKHIIDSVFSAGNFVGLFPVKIRHRDRQLMINATYHDVFEYLLIYRKNRTQRFECDYKDPAPEKFAYRVVITDDRPERARIGGKDVAIYDRSQYDIVKTQAADGLRRYMIAGKLKTANWSGEWFEKNLRELGPGLLVKVQGLEKAGLGYRWFETQTEKRRSGRYYQSRLGAGRPILPSNDLDFTDDVTSVFKEGGDGCDFKDSKKPEKLIDWLLAITTREGDLVIDLFGGSGTTLAVCEKRGRSCIIVEKHEEPYAILLTRIRNIERADGISLRVAYTDL